MHDWYENHRMLKLFSTAAQGVALVNAADAAADIFFNKPVVTAAARAEETPKLDIGGDLRTRWMYVEGTDGGDKRTVESRARLNLGYKLSDYLNLRVRGVAEHSTIPGFDHRFEKDKRQIFFIDRAFAEYLFGEDFCLTAGAFDNTFTGWMERDVPLVGAQAKFTTKNIPKMNRITAKLAYHIGQPWLDESDSGFWAFELEGEKALSKAWKFIGNVNYMHWFDLDPGFIRTNLRDGSGYASDFRLVNGGIKFVHDTIDIPFFKGPLSLYGNVMHNLGARKENDGFIVGVGAGGLNKPGDASIGFEYRYIEADAAVAGYAPKITPCTNMKKPFISCGYQIGENLALMGALAFPERLGRKGDAWEFGAVQLQYKF